MLPNTFKAVAFAAVAAATLAASAVPASAFTLSSNSPAASAAGADVQQVWWDQWRRWHPDHHEGWDRGWGHGPEHYRRHCEMTPWGERCRHW